jgi:hypothetical protein
MGAKIVVVVDELHERQSVHARTCQREQPAAHVRTKREQLNQCAQQVLVKSDKTLNLATSYSG